MRKVKDDYSEEGQVIEYKKDKSVYYIVIFTLIGCGMLFFMDFNIIIDALQHDRIDFNMTRDYLGSLFFSLSLTMSSGYLASYNGNKIIISDSFITIRRPAFGKVYKISKSCIMAKEYKVTYGRGGNSRIYLYLKNGKKISTGLLHGDYEICSIIYDEFKGIKEIGDIKLSKGGLYSLKKIKLDKGDLVIKSNYIIKILIWGPVIFFVVAGYFLISKYKF